MKKNLLPLLLAATLFTAPSCKKLCDDFHEGSFCKTEVREKYYGTYNGYSSLIGNFAVTIAAGNNTDARSFDLDGIKARLTNSTDFTITSQYVIYGSTYANVSGYGNFTGNVLHQYLTVNSTSVYLQASK